MASSKTPLFSSLLLFFFSISTPYLSSAQQPPPFSCRSPGATCSALIDYVSPNSTTISAITSLFSVRNNHSLLGANNLPVSTPLSFPIAARRTIKIPFPCICTTNGTGISNGGPIYTVAPGDTLYHIAAEVFSGLVVFPQIAAANNITDSELITVGQRLRIPLPCSCDDVDGQRVVHYGYVVPAGSTVPAIAAQFNTTEATLLRLSNLSSPADLLANSVLDVPLRTCSSMVSNTSRDYPLLVPNGTYIFTANDCVTCSCNAASNWMLHCEPSRINSSSSCSSTGCSGSPNLNLGTSTTSGCNRTTCAYAGYNGQRILTTLSSDSTCPVSDNRSSGMSLRVWRWNELLVCIQTILLSFLFL